MATWNSPQPLKITQTRPSKEKATNFDGFVEIQMGEKVPDELVNEDFIGNCLDQLANLTSDDQAKLAAWKAKNPRIANKWDHIDRSPMLVRTIFPPESSILTVGGSKRGA